MYNGCYDQINLCKESASGPKGGYINESNGNVITEKAAYNPSIDSACQEAADMCRDNVEVRGV